MSGLPVTSVPERELCARGGVALGMPAEQVRRHMTDLGRPLGPLWRQDQKGAAGRLAAGR